MELKRVILSVVRYHFIQVVLMRTSAYLGKVAENTPFSKESSKTIIEIVELQKINIVLKLYPPISYLPATCDY